jgi:hypothetical protein
MIYCDCFYCQFSTLSQLLDSFHSSGKELSKKGKRSECFYTFAPSQTDIDIAGLLKGEVNKMDKDHTRHALRIAVGITVLIIIISCGVGNSTFK